MNFDRIDAALINVLESDYCRIEIRPADGRQRSAGSLESDYCRIEISTGRGRWPGPSTLESDYCRIEIFRYCF